MAYVEYEIGYEGPGDSRRDNKGNNWGVYETDCLRCGRPITHVAYIPHVDEGYVTIESLCMECKKPPMNPN